MSIPYLDLPFYKIFLQTPILFCSLVSFSSTHIFSALKIYDPKFGIWLVVINVIQYVHEFNECMNDKMIHT